MKLFIALLPILFTSCSVIMASDCDGVGIDTLQQVSSREQLIELGAISIEDHGLEGGKHAEIFLLKNEHGSISRAAINGVLDVMTGFLWELAATPLELALKDRGTYSVKVTFDEKDQIEAVELTSKSAL